MIALARARWIVVVALFAACDAPRSSPRVVVLGIDGLGPPLLQSLLVRGELPTFARLVMEGSFGRVSTLDTGLPPLSPRIWTSFATGQLPDVHGILAFQRLAGTRRVLQVATDRRSPALWEIASATGKRVGVINWPITYPAEPVDGFMVTDRYLPWTAKPAGTEADPAGQHLVYPPGLMDLLRPLGIVAPGRPPWTADEAARIDRDVFELTYAVLADHPVDLLLLYTRALDELQHLAWGTHEPLPGEPEPARDEIEEYLRRYDGMLGELLAHLTPADTLVVLSDHGAERNRGPEGLAGTHRSRATATGVLLLHGPRVRHGGVNATTIDVAPTVLELLGVAPAADMPGQVLAAALPPGTVLLPRRAEPYARRRSEAPAATAHDGGGSAVEHRLRDLGYVE